MPVGIVEERSIGCGGCLTVVDKSSALEDLCCAEKEGTRNGHVSGPQAPSLPRSSRLSLRPPRHIAPPYPPLRCAPPQGLSCARVLCLFLLLTFAAEQTEADIS